MCIDFFHDLGVLVTIRKYFPLTDAFHVMLMIEFPLENELVVPESIDYVIILGRLQDVIFGIYSLKMNQLLLIMGLADSFESIIAHEDISFHQVLSSDLSTDLANYILVTS